jgi:anti-anti-sigma factor
MDIKVVDTNGIKIVSFIGELDSTTAPETDKALKALIEAGATKIIINFVDVEYISSAGLRILLGAAKSLTAKGGGLKMCNLNEVVQEVFDISGFSSIFSLSKTEQDAIQAF